MKQQRKKKHKSFFSLFSFYGSNENSSSCIKQPLLFRQLFLIQYCVLLAHICHRQNLGWATQIY